MTTATTNGNESFNPEYIVAPGETVADLLEEHDMTQSELARRLGASAKHVNQLIKGVATISSEVALGLEKVLGPSASFWLTREAQYQAGLAAQQEEHQLAACLPWANAFPIKELKKRNFIPRDATGPGLVVHLLRFLGVAKPDHWIDPTVAYRKSQKFESDPFALSAWLRQGEIEANRVECNLYDHDRFLDALQDIRLLTPLDPEDWEPELVRLCSAAGVAVVIVEAFPKARVNGATRWLRPSKALIQLSLRHKWEDIFWFSFFHEAGHVALHRKKDVYNDVFIDTGRSSGDQVDPTGKRQEAEADRFAGRTLIPEVFDRRLRRASLEHVEELAQQIGVAPAIIVGRLQHDGVIPYSAGNQLRRRFEMCAVDD